MNYFEVLGINKHTYLGEATDRFQNLLKQLDPDKDAKKIIEIREAWDKIKNKLTNEPVVYFREIDGIFYRWISISGPGIGNKSPYVGYARYEKSSSDTYKAICPYIKYLPKSEQVIKTTNRKIEIYTYKGVRSINQYVFYIRGTDDGQFVIDKGV